MYDFLVKEIRFSQQITNIETSLCVNSHRQRVYYRMVDSVCRSDAQGVEATLPWNNTYCGGSNVDPRCTSVLFALPADNYELSLCAFEYRNTAPLR
jgi:hypothetical protein